MSWRSVHETVMETARLSLYISVLDIISFIMTASEHTVLHAVLYI